MFEQIKRKLSLKVSIILGLIMIPPMILAAFILSSREGAKLEERIVANGKLAAISGAEMYGTVLETGVDGGHFTMDDLMNPVYEEIKGFKFGENPRFHTKFDYYTDATVMEFQDALLDSSPDFLYVIGNDVNGYAPTHDSKFQQASTDDMNKNRTKRKFTTAVHQAAAKSLAPVLVQSYKRDTGHDAWDISSPIFVKGQHFGVFRIGVSRDSIAHHRNALLLDLVVVFLFLSVVTIGSIFFILRRSMKPLEKLATTATEISTGEGLDQPIKAATTDEIGQMAKSLNRLRASLQAAMARIGE
jgi:HAMP domain-containing protein